MKTQTTITELTVSEVMTKRVEKLDANDTVREAVGVMLDNKLSTIPVVNANNEVIGMLSRADLTEMFLKEDQELGRILDTDRLTSHWLSQAYDTGDLKLVKEMMTHDVETIQSTQSVADACIAMSKNRIHHLPVVDNKNALQGIISTLDVVGTIAEWAT